MPDERDDIERLSEGIREMLQGVEDTLIDAGYDDFKVATEHGDLSLADAFERAQADAAAQANDLSENVT